LELELAVENCQLIRIRISFPQKDRTLNNNNRYRTSLMVHMKSVLSLLYPLKQSTMKS